jgi:SAM-dependent methyltransferase
MDNDLRNRLRETYNRHAQARDSSTPQPWKLEERLNFLKLVQLEDKHTFLEVGAGPGRDGEFFQDHGLEVICIDLSPEMVQLCRQKGLKAYVMDVAKLAFSPDAFDATYALNSLLHLREAELPETLKGISRVMRPQGLFYLGVYGGFDFEGVWENDSYEPKRFFSFLTDEHLRSIAEETFDLLAFNTIPVDKEKPGLHFQSLILRKRNF